jgi:hypothetical protein
LLSATRRKIRKKEKVFYSSLKEHLYPEIKIIDYYIQGIRRTHHILSHWVPGDGSLVEVATQVEGCSVGTLVLIFFAVDRGMAVRRWSHPWWFRIGRLHKSVITFRRFLLRGICSFTSVCAYCTKS